MGILANLLLGAAAEDDGPTGWEHPPSIDCDCEDCDERWRVAVHESGHVIAFEHFGEPWINAEIMLDDNGNATGGGVVRCGDTSDIEDMVGAQIYTYLVIGHAGFAAEESVFGEAGSSSGDNANIDQLLERWGDPDADAQAADEAADIIDEHADELLELAEQLFYQAVVWS